MSPQIHVGPMGRTPAFNRRRPSKAQVAARNANLAQAHIQQGLDPILAPTSSTARPSRVETRRALSPTSAAQHYKKKYENARREVRRLRHRVTQLKEENKAVVLAHKAALDAQRLTIAQATTLKISQATRIAALEDQLASALAVKTNHQSAIQAMAHARQPICPAEATLAPDFSSDIVVFKVRKHCRRGFAFVDKAWYSGREYDLPGPSTWSFSCVSAVRDYVPPSRRRRPSQGGREHQRSPDRARRLQSERLRRVDESCVSDVSYFCFGLFRIQHSHSLVKIAGSSIWRFYLDEGSVDWHTQTV